VAEVRRRRRKKKDDEDDVNESSRWMHRVFQSEINKGSKNII
jgi:hypothetical protein